MKDIIIIVAIAIIISLAIYYVYREKKNGKKCIGCPENCSCNKKHCDKSK